MDIATIAGIVSGIAVIGGAIVAGGDPMGFVDLPSAMIVFGGTTAATLIKFPMSDLMTALKTGISVGFKNPPSDPQSIYDKAIEMSGIVRKNGLLGLESVKIEHELFARGIRMCTDGLSHEVIEATINRELTMGILKQEKGELIFRGIGDAAPAFGMIGTLVGLVQMLANLDDPAAIGPAMAIAMLTTFYGAFIANLIALPLADKLAFKTEQDRLGRELVVESVLQIQQQQNPNVMEEILKAYLPVSGGGGKAKAKGKKK